MAEHPEDCGSNVLRCLFHSGVNRDCCSLSALLDGISHCLRGQRCMSRVLLGEAPVSVCPQAGGSAGVVQVK